MTNIKKYNHYTNTVTIKKYINISWVIPGSGRLPLQQRDAGKHRSQNHTDWSDTEDDFEHQTSLGAIVTVSIVL